MDFTTITNLTVRKAIAALHHRERDSFFKLLSSDVKLIHNGKPEDMAEWAGSFFFGQHEARFTTIDKVADEGTTVYASLDSELAGQVKTLLAFTISNGMITRLSAGKADE